MFFDNLLDGADPGGNLGGTFTANIVERQLVPKGAYLDHFIISFGGTVSTAAVVLDSFIGLLSQFTFKAGQDVRIQLNASDMINVMAHYYGLMPSMWEETASSGSDFILGIKIPVQETIDSAQRYAWSANYTAVSNISAGVLQVTAVYYDDAKGRKPLVIVPINYTSASATGYTNPGFIIPPLGFLIGLLWFQTTVPKTAAATYDIQRIQMVIDGQFKSKLAAVSGGIIPSGLSGGAQAVGVLEELYDPYIWWDFRDEPFDVKSHRFELQVDVEVTGEATRFIPIIQKA